MTRQLAFLGLAGALASAQMVTITDTAILSPVDGQPFAGRIQITSPNQMTFEGATYVGWQRTYCLGMTDPSCIATFAAGSLTLQLLANTTATPAGTSYTVRYTPQRGTAWVEYWVVFASEIALKINQVRVPQPPVPSILVQPQQIAGAGALTGQALCWSGTSWAPGACTASGGSGLAGYRIALDEDTAVTVLGTTHTFPSANILVQCFETSGAPVEPQNVNVNTTTRDVSITFALPQSGSCVLSTSTLSHSEPLTAATGVVIAADRHGIRSVSGLACFDPGGNLIQTGAVNFLPTILNIGGVLGPSLDISIEFAVPQSGRCALIGV